MAKRKVYYFYNSKSLRYERVYPSVKERFISAIKQIVLSAVFGALIIGGLLFFVDSPDEVLLKNEYNLLLSRYKMLDRQLDEATAVVQDIEERDHNLYRALFMADPIAIANHPVNHRNDSLYRNLAHLSNAKLVISSSEKMDALSRRLYFQSKSFDDLLEVAKTQEERLKCIPAIQPVANKDLKYTASGYGMRIDPIYHQLRFHAGMDFNARIGTNVYVTGDGTVTYADWRQGYGNTVIVDHGFGYQTLYGHLNKYKVTVGQKVKRGEVIGEVGNTGKSTGPHLHYEVLVRGVHDNPAKYYFMDLTPEEYDRMIRIAENQGQVMD
jgi:murein DD-endopeptidase MepM/ murein hydrolase activator NlpD